MPKLPIFLLICLAAAPAIADDLPTFDVNFVVVTAESGAKPKTTLDKLRAEVDILNKHFVSEDGKQLVRFRFKSATMQREVAASSCPLVETLDSAQTYSGKWLHVFKACTDPRIRDPKAINFLVYDAFAEKKGRGDVTSKGGVVGGRPYVLIDWERLGHGKQAPEEHEMGHAFGLRHVCVEGARLKDATNIMSSGEKCARSAGGTRELGFTASQVKTIRKNAARYLKFFSAGGEGEDSAE